jgi:hypothetical protein
MYGYDIDLKWKDNILRHRNMKYAEVIPHSKYPKMFYIRWANGDLSADFYNISRAKDHAVNYAIKEILPKEIECA